MKTARDVREISKGLYGWLESPRPFEETLDCVLLSGWAFSTSSPIAEIVVQIGTRQERAQFGLPRNDVEAAYPDARDADHSGFFGYFEIGASHLRPTELKVWATLADGRRVGLFSRPLTSGPMRNRVRQLVSAAGGLVARLRARHIAPSPLEASTTTTEFLTSCRADLQTFLASGTQLTFSESAPLVSVIVVLWNRAELTLRCLRALLAQTGVPLDVVLVDNHSSDMTPALLALLRGVTIVTNNSNLGFTVAANQGAARARGDYLLFLNNDAVVWPDAITKLVGLARDTPAIGAIGGKLVFPDGRLQEAGAIVWSDGSCESYGRGSDPGASAVTFRRDVDFCSGAFLLTSRERFQALGGFDECYRPAYYEDADYCVRLWKSGHRVVYEPTAVATHVEFGSSQSRESALTQQRQRQALFAVRHREWLANQRARTDGIRLAATRRRSRQAVVVIDDSWPQPSRGAGFPRAAALLRALIDLDYLVAFYPMDGRQPGTERRDRLAEVEVVSESGLPHLRSFLQSDHGFDLAIVSRPHNLQHVKVTIGSDLTGAGIPIVYDAEAVYAVREIGRRRVIGSALVPADEEALLEKELALARGCAAVLTVNDRERRRFLDAGASDVAVVGHALSPTPTSRDFESRTGLLFVGALDADSPNEDAVLFLIEQILPALDNRLREVPVRLVGARISERISRLVNGRVTVQSGVANLTADYASVRLFVAPTRFAAGVPLKLYEAAAHGLPIVCTPMLAEQLGWVSEIDVLTASSAAGLAQAIERLHGDRDLWQSLRDSALERVTRECSPALFQRSLEVGIKSIRSRADQAIRSPERFKHGDR